MRPDRIESRKLPGPEVEEAMDKPTPNAALTRMNALVGEWNIEGSHVHFPTTKIRGKTTFEWLDGGFFLVQRSQADHPDVPNSISVIGCDDEADHCTMHYFDSRGVSRNYAMTLSDGVWKMWRDAPGFSQRFTGTFDASGGTISGAWELSKNGSTWEHDFDLLYTKAG
jgi:hypothetical protein